MGEARGESVGEIQDGGAIAGLQRFEEFAGEDESVGALEQGGIVEQVAEVLRLADIGTQAGEESVEIPGAAGLAGAGKPVFKGDEGDGDAVFIDEVVLGGERSEVSDRSEKRFLVGSGERVQES